jgi:inosine/xanthosine triphosphatase
VKIKVGSKNKVKIQGVLDAVQLYPSVFQNAEVEGVDVSIDAFEHPKNIGEISEGAVNRAKQAFTVCDYSFGLESGLMEVPHSKSGYMEIQICAIFDGKDIHLGLSTGFEWPRKVTDLIVSGQADGSQAFKMAGYAENEKQGAETGGIIGILTNGLKTREEQIKESIIMAMIHLEHPDKY